MVGGYGHVREVCMTKGRPHSCKNKTPYVMEQEAKNASVDRGVGYYHCTHCGMFHLVARR